MRMEGHAPMGTGQAWMLIALVSAILPASAHAQVLLDRLTLRDGSVVVGKIVSDAATGPTLFTTRMNEQFVSTNEIMVYEKIEMQGNPFRLDKERSFYCSIITTVRLKDGKEFRGVSLDRQGNHLWLLSPEAYLLRIPFESISDVLQQPFDAARRHGPTELPPPSTGYAPETTSDWQPSASTRPKTAPPPAPQPAQAAPPPVARAEEDAIEEGPLSSRVYGGVLLGFHDQGSGPLEEFYGSGMSFGGFLGARFISWAGARVGLQYFSKTVIDPDSRKWNLTKMPIDVSATLHPIRSGRRFVPYIGFGPGMTSVSQDPDAFVRQELKKDLSTSDWVFHYHLFGGGRVKVLDKLGALIEFRYSSAPFEDQSHNLDAGGIDFLLGVRWQ